METESLSTLQQGEEECRPPKADEGFHGAVQRAGDVLNQGVQAVKDGAIKLYNKVRGTGETRVTSPAYALDNVLSVRSGFGQRSKIMAKSPSPHAPFDA